ncbi:MAG: 3-oxoacyl-ACP reductase FabG [Planctomycetota bacterium]|jgi:NAD(P)-dependent dehydrogenase (short-subunit alcohol dehydrogenase family)
MDLRLRDKKALVTGGSRGIGAAIARVLRDEGCDVAITHVGDAERAAELGMPAYEADVRDAEAAQRIVDEIKELDILVCNAGITADGVFWKMTDEQWESVLDINLKGAFFYCRAAMPHLRARGGGAIVAVTSINGLRGKFGQANYAASKAGLIGFVKSIAREAGRFNITANAVAPGMVETEMADAVPEEFRRAAEAETVTGRIAQPEDIAHAVAFLCSPLARHITGTVVRVDGGQAM